MFGLQKYCVDYHAIVGGTVTVALHLIDDNKNDDLFRSVKFYYLELTI